MAGLLGRGIGPLQGHYLHSTAQHKETPTYISRAGFEPSIAISGQSKMIRALDRAATATGAFTYIRTGRTNITKCRRATLQLLVFTAVIM